MTPGLEERLGARVVARLTVPGPPGAPGRADAVVLRVPGSLGAGLAPVTRPPADVLDAGERARLARFAQAADRVRYQVAHTALRMILGARTGVHPADLRFARAPCPRCGGPHGRPVLTGQATAPEFSLSHGGDLVAVAVADDPVGVDVDRDVAARAGRDLLPLLHPRERRLVVRASDITRGTELTRVWTRKEAYLKGLGVGLGRALDADDVTAPLPGWTIVDRLVEEHFVALAVRGRE